jgi:hypothetical protein
MLGTMEVPWIVAGERRDSDEAAERDEDVRWVR